MSSIAIYPGSFDPFTIGHLDIVERASKIFKQIEISIGINSSKKPFFELNLRIEAIKLSTAHLKNVKVDMFNGLLVEHVRERKANVVIRGLRAISDFDYEFQIAMANRQLAPEIETAFLMTQKEYSFITSSVVREIVQLGGDYTSFVPSAVARLIDQKYKEKNLLR